MRQALDNPRYVAIGEHWRTRALAASLVAAALTVVASGQAQAAISCERQVTADVVAFDKPLMYNRLGASNVNGMMYALKRDVVNVSDKKPLTVGGAATPGQIDLRPDKRHRPLVLRVRVGDCLTVNLTNLLTVNPNPNNAPLTDAAGVLHTVQNNDQIRDRAVSFHAAGMQVVDSINSDGSWVGANAFDGHAPPAGGTRTYKLYAEKEGAFLVTGGGPIGSDQTQGNSANGLFGQVIVQPAGARIYRSQVHEEELRLVADANRNGVLEASEKTALGQPKLADYEATYPTGAPWSDEGKAGLPILNMINCTTTATGSGRRATTTTSCEIVHSDTSAIVAGPNADWTFPASTYPLESKGKRNPTVPNRLEPFRDFAQLWHDEVTTGQAFPGFFKTDPVFRYVLQGVKDGFMINYGSGGIGSEIIANRVGVGPMHDCLSCAYEEFFLTSFTVGDPGLVVDVPANFGLETLLPGQAPPPGTQGPKANYVIGADDPSNVHHSYVGDFVKFRNTHVGKEQHVFHLHNHQWLYNPNDDNSNYLDAQGIGPGGSYTYEINFGGSGNRNKTAGDAIFHCHFYPHFAQGMWYHWRINDTLESGSILNATPATNDAQGFATASGYHTTAWGLAMAKPKAGTRAYPDGEIVAGTPIPAVVPLPGKPMPVVPGRVTTKPNPVLVPEAINALTPPVGSLANVIDRDRHPGFPFFIAGMEDIIGQRPPTPQLDMLTKAQATALKNSGNALWAEINPEQADGFDGGLPRHALKGVAAGGKALTVTSRLDFSKVLLESDVVYYPEEGTDLEKVAMAFHAQRCIPTYKPDGTLAACADDATRGPIGGFVLNGSKPVIGAPYQNPCMDDAGSVLKAGTVGRFFSGETLTGMNTRGASLFNSDNPRIYKGTNMQFDAVLNKVGYHYPQQRIIALWQDVKDIITKAKAPEPLVMRLNTFDCAVFHHSNLVPELYELDDYQVRTPTDIIGQHIHLPKWDLTTADGAANGWNYEDGTLSPAVVVERIHAIRHFNHCLGKDSGDTRDGTGACPVAKEHPYWGKVAGQLGGKFPEEWKGARTTIQRWFSDPVVNTDGVDRGLGIIFTHDHYGPSTHQQVGLYATVLAEPAGSRWAHNETGQQLGYDPMTGAPARTDTRLDGTSFSDGGPASWQAAIIPQAQTGVYASNTVNAQPCTSATQVSGVDCQATFREFYFEYADFQHAYEAGVYVGADQQGLPLDTHAAGLPMQTLNLGNPQWDGTEQNAFRFAMHLPGREQINPVFPDLYVEHAGRPDPDFFCPVRPCPQAIDVQDPGLLVVNYRQEPIALRIYDPRKIGPDGKPGMQADGSRGDLAFALQSRRDRALKRMNEMPDGNTVIFGTRFPPHINTGELDRGDPFTPTMRVYAGDHIRVKMQAGAHEEEHNATIHGLKWLQAGSGHGTAKNSGWRNNQAGGISEQFTLNTPVLPVDQARGNFVDYAYSLNASHDGWWSGVWGLMRSYEREQGDLFKLPGTLSGPARVANGNQWKGVCPVGAPARSYDISAVLANNALPNALGVTVAPPGPVGTMHVGGALDSAGGTLIFNNRDTTVTGQGLDPNTGAVATLTHQGPLHDPTAIMYVRTSDLDANGKLLPTAPVEPLVLRALPGECVTVTLRNRLPGVQLASTSGGFGGGGLGGAWESQALISDTSTVNAADGSGASISGIDGLGADGNPLSPLSTSLMPDLAHYATVIGVVKRDRFSPEGSTTFNRNLFRPSAYAGLHPQLVAFDVSRHDGMPVGRNRTGGQFAAPGATVDYTWYVGDIGGQPSAGDVTLVGTPIEFGGFNLTPADKMKQGSKSMVGAAVIEPAGTMWVEDTQLPDRQDGAGTRLTRAQATVCVPSASTGGGKKGGGTGGGTCDINTAGAFRDFSLVMTKAMNHYYKDAAPVANLNGIGTGIPEDPKDSSSMALNYAAEPLWFRFGILPQAPFGGANVAGSYASPGNSHQAYSNTLLTGTVTCDANNNCTGDPQTPVFQATAGKEARIHITGPYGTMRGSTFALHGHTWQRDPYICPGESRNGLAGACNMTSVGSRALGINPLGFIQSGQESWSAVNHYDILLPLAGGGNAVKGDYLIRDMGSYGNASGLWNIFRVK